MKWALIIASLVCTFLAFISGLLELHIFVIIGLFFKAIVLLFVAFRNDFESFKATRSGFEARTRSVIENAENTVSELKSLAIIFAEINLSCVKRTGRWGGFTHYEEDRFKESVLSVLNQIGVSDTESEGVLKDWHRFTEFDYVDGILGNHIPEGIEDPKFGMQFKELGKLNNIPSPKKLLNFLTNWQLLDDDRSEYIKDYEYYIKYRDHRRPQTWGKRKSWGSLKKNSDKV